MCLGRLDAHTSTSTHTPAPQLGARCSPFSSSSRSAMRPIPPSQNALPKQRGRLRTEMMRSSERSAGTGGERGIGSRRPRMHTHTPAAARPRGAVYLPEARRFDLLLRVSLDPSILPVGAAPSAHRRPRPPGPLHRREQLPGAERHRRSPPGSVRPRRPGPRRRLPHLRRRPARGPPRTVLLPRGERPPPPRRLAPPPAAPTEGAALGGGPEVRRRPPRCGGEEAVGSLPCSHPNPDPPVAAATRGRGGGWRRRWASLGVPSPVPRHPPGCERSGCGDSGCSARRTPLRRAGSRETAPLPALPALHLRSARRLRPRCQIPPTPHRAASGPGALLPSGEEVGRGGDRYPGRWEHGNGQQRGGKHLPSCFPRERPSSPAPSRGLSFHGSEFVYLFI